jgi:hypothetical protein
MFHIPVRVVMIALAVAAVSPVFGVIAPASASAAVAPATASAATSCTGSYPYNEWRYSGKHYAHEYGWFWSTTGAVCVGQADLAENVTNATGLDERVRIRDGGASGPQLAEYKSGGKISGNAIVFTTHVSRVFYYSVITVCVAVIHQSDGSVVPDTTVCHSL